MVRFKSTEIPYVSLRLLVLNARTLLTCDALALLVAQQLVFGVSALHDTLKQKYYTHTIF